VVADGEVVRAAGLEIEAIATPGHASHHHVYRVGDAVFTGDLAAIVIPPTDHGQSSLVELPTPPPEYDLELWQRSLERLSDLRPRVIYPTHFGEVEEVEKHIDLVNRLLTESTDIVRREILRGVPRREIVSTFETWTADRLIASGATVEQLRDITAFNPPSLSLAGILRYWKKRGLVTSDAS
jgi:glyoxylase-like metal-dependent hydrolase (beta-lactamase superfamily II)